MRRLALVVLVLGSFGSVACGSAAETLPMVGGDGGPAASEPSPLPGQAPGADGGRAEGRPAEPPAPPAKAEEVTEQYGVFVAKDGAAENPGTRKSPLASITEGIAKAKADKKGRVYVCEGTYLESLELESGVSIVGGLDCSGPTWKLTDKRSTLEAPSSPAIRAVGITIATRVDGLEVKAPNATSPSGSSIGLFAIDSNALTFGKGSITAGDGMKGDDGVEAEQLSFAARNGESGQAPASASGILAPRAGGLESEGVCRRPDGTEVMRSYGGRGGDSGMYSRSVVNEPWNELNRPGGPSNPTGTGAAGKSGVSSSGGTLTEEGFAPGDGTAGTNGDIGLGGKGASGKAVDRGVFGTGRWFGESGAGGGAGGCPGLAGTAGKGGGASFAVALVRSPVRFDGMTLVSGQGGAGGRGTVGSEPTAGSTGGNDASLFDNDATYKSRPGTKGGEAGVSGHGAGGPSIAIAHEGIAPILTQTTTKPGAAGEGVAAVTKGSRTLPASAAGESAAVKAY
ncbi:MAG: hypothetical protein U0183_19405 [Polyangiaceae bacterium]